jgi:hypothetical protein
MSTHATAARDEGSGVPVHRNTKTVSVIYKYRIVYSSVDVVHVSRYHLVPEYQYKYEDIPPVDITA